MNWLPEPQVDFLEDSEAEVVEPASNAHRQMDLKLDDWIVVPVQVREACSLEIVVEDVVFEAFDSAFKDGDLRSNLIHSLDCPSFDHRPVTFWHKTMLTELETDELSLCRQHVKTVVKSVPAEKKF